MKWLLLCLHLFFFYFPSFSSFNSLCHQDEYSALLQFKSSFDIYDGLYPCDEVFMKTKTWENGSDCCSWKGITCDTVYGHVIGLNLGCEGLRGALHPNSTLFHLTHLQTLNLSGNDFLKSHFDSKFGGFMSLKHLDLSSSSIQGDVSPQISHLSKLTSLYLSDNSFLVWKESTLKRLVQNATNLRELFSDDTDMSLIRENSIGFLFNHSSSLVTLNLGNTGLSGNFKQNILCFPSIQELYMSQNYFGSQLPELSCSKFLRILDFSFSAFLGPIPPSFSNLTYLTSLNLKGNSLNGSIPSSLLILPSLTLLDLSHNDLSGQIPNVFHQSNQFQELDLSDNKIGRELPISLSNLHHLINLYLSENSFKGRIPGVFGGMTKLQQLNLASNNLEGQIPSSLFNLNQLVTLDCSDNNLSGQIPNVFHQSNQFQELDLRFNQIGGELPISLSNLHHLINLDLSGNSFKGRIPDVFGGMTKLQQLNLGSNNLEGQIPSSLFNLKQLVELDCSDNKLVGPLVNKFSWFQKLTILILDNNLLNGTIPSSLLSLPCLKSLSLSNNRFTGNISAISCYSLEELDLCHNKLQGNIPKSIFNLSNLTRLCLSSNNLSGVVDFHLFSKLQKLVSLSLSYNSQLSLNIETNVNYHFSLLTTLELSSLNLNKLPTYIKGRILKYVDMSNNKLTGRVPNWLFETISEYGFLNLSQNMFTSIEEISFPKYRIRSLDLSFNLLQGELSASICNMDFLRFLNLAHNKLTGTFPQCLVSLGDLEILDLQMNKLYGTLPNKISKDSELVNLNLYGNNLEGGLPETLCHCKKLEVLNLGSNRIQGKFPNWLQTLENLKVLVLRDNKLHGFISNLRISCSFPSLFIFDISGNNFSGPLPKTYFKKFQAMKDENAIFSYMRKSLNFNGRFGYIGYADSGYIGYYDSVTVRIKGINTTLVKISNNFAIIDMSRNKFEGEIPNVVGELHALIGFNISHNRLGGIIPRSMENLINLESLDLSSNMITGVIPVELSNLNFLEFLDLSNNLLVGEIPQGNQFYTFSNDSYEGNSELCGLPLSKKCGPEQQSPPSPNKPWNEEKFRFGWKPVAIGYGCGFVFGIGLGYCMFLIGKPRWLVIIFGGQPKRRVRRRTRVRRTNGSTMNQMIQMS